MATLRVFLLKKMKLPMLPAVDLYLCGVVLTRREKESVRVEGAVNDDYFSRLHWVPFVLSFNFSCFRGKEGADISGDGGWMHGFSVSFFRFHFSTPSPSSHIN